MLRVAIPWEPKAISAFCLKFFQEAESITPTIAGRIVSDIASVPGCEGSRKTRAYVMLESSVSVDAQPGFVSREKGRSDGENLRRKVGFDIPAVGSWTYVSFAGL